MCARGFCWRAPHGRDGRLARWGLRFDDIARGSWTGVVLRSAQEAEANMGDVRGTGVLHGLEVFTRCGGGWCGGLSHLGEGDDGRGPGSASVLGSEGRAMATAPTVDARYGPVNFMTAPAVSRLRRSARRQSILSSAFSGPSAGRPLPYSLRPCFYARLSLRPSPPSLLPVRLASSPPAACISPPEALRLFRRPSAHEPFDVSDPDDLPFLLNPSFFTHLSPLSRPPPTPVEPIQSTKPL